MRGGYVLRVRARGVSLRVVDPWAIVGFLVHMWDADHRDHYNFLATFVMDMSS